MTEEFRPLLVLDFDGVIHSYDSPWTTALEIRDGVTPGFFAWAEQAHRRFRLMVYSSRSREPGGNRAMKDWLFAQWRETSNEDPPRWLLELEFCFEKPSAFLTIDDRGLTFTGSWADFDPDDLRAFRPWNKKAKPP